jgi:hypothetical protein
MVKRRDGIRTFSGEHKIGISALGEGLCHVHLLIAVAKNWYALLYDLRTKIEN